MDRFYESHVFCCINEDGCGKNGTDKLQKYMKARAKELGIAGVRINKSGCLGRCDLGPTMVVYPEGVWYHYKTQQDIDSILSEHLMGGRIVERLRLNTDQTVLTPEQAA